ncbi:hypothetical protein ILUMI_04344 [Ignelater luminosus]|uniref:Copia protein n=1 Tax=Ignelater luminosus TaxID=2038154 RepID=A0A8K0DD13_IGNLU|nr:hypothetical protein ILUMI_04344 [Ignelater luminosus]
MSLKSCRMGLCNWAKWKTLISLLLKKHSLMDIVSGDREKPVVPAAGALDATYLTDLKKWESDDTEAILYIMTTLDDQTSTLVMTCTSAKAVWSNIATHVAKLQKHFSVFNSALKKQKKNELGDRILIAPILSTLGLHFREFRNVWEAMPSSDRTLKDLVEKLRTIEQRDSVEVQKAAFLSQTQNKPKQLLVNSDIKQK